MNQLHANRHADDRDTLIPVAATPHNGTVSQRVAPPHRSRRQERWRTRYGPWAVVTGASDGVGKAMAERLAAAGLHLVLVARRRDVLDQLAADLTARHGVDVLVVSADLAQRAGVDVVEAATRDLDVGLLVAAAGFGTSGRLVDGDLEQEVAMLHVNCLAVTLQCHQFGRRLAERGRGGIILMSSLLAFQGVPYSAHYGATKAYVQSLAEALQRELAPSGVDVLASAPGPIHSGFGARASMRMGTALQPATVARATLSALGRTTTIRPGWLSKALDAALLPLPRWARVRMMGRLMSNMTQRPTGAVRKRRHAHA